MKRLFAAFLLSFLTSIALGQQIQSSGSWTGSIAGSASLRTYTEVVCAPDTPGQPAGCDTVVQGLTGSSGSYVGAEASLTPIIASCGSSQTPTFTATSSGTTLTVTSFLSGNAIYVGMPLNGAGISTAIWIKAFVGSAGGGAGQYTLSSSLTVSTAETMTGPQGACRILLRQGTYNICASIVIDRSFIDISGEGVPMWGSYVTSMSGGSGATVGTVGTGFTKIQQNFNCAGGNTYNGIVLSDANVPDDGEGRHRGQGLHYLYIVGGNLQANYTTVGGIAYGIYDFSGNDDSDHFDHLMLQHWYQAMYAKLDNAYVDHINLQDDYNGMDLTGEVDHVTQIIGYDINNVGLQVGNAGGWGIQVTDSEFGDCGGTGTSAACVVLANSSTLSGNVFSSTAGSSVECASKSVVTGNVIDETEGQFTTKTRATAPILVTGSGAQNCAISGNVVIPNGTESEYAIDVSGATGNTVIGNTVGSGFNGASSTTINVGTGNTVTNNNGDSH